jgi:nitrile hydratase beta subunit
MNGVHDMGGMQGYGPVQREVNEPIFHEAWERQAMGLTVLMGGSGPWNIDQARSARESLPPSLYLSSSYYQIWIEGLERLMLARGLVSAHELHTGAMSAPALPVRVIAADQVDAAMARGTSAERPVRAPARFEVGQRVRARQMHPTGHTRLPRYVRGHIGTVQAVRGVHVLPDRHTAHPPTSEAEQGEWLYTVVFDARDLWGAQADPTVRVSVDAWEPYLEPVVTA